MRAETAQLPHHHKRPTCRLCDSRALDCVLELTPTPPANALISPADRNRAQVTYPLDVYRCRDCGHLQLLDIVDPKVLFSHYVYVSSTSPVMVDYLRDQASAIITRLGLKRGDLVVEIGSNDGTLLRFFKAAGMRVLGVDPAANIVPDPSDVETITDFFDAKLGARIRQQHGPAAAVCAYNVCAHIDDLQGVITGVKALLAPGGHFVFEVGYLLDVYRKTLFDTIYHEHVDFHHVGPLRGFFARNDLKLVHAERSDIQGGALVGYVGHAEAAEDESVATLVAEEREAGFDKADTFLLFGERIARRRDELTALLIGLKAKGKSIAAYGAPAKATTLMYHFGIDRSLIEYVVDDNPIKQGLLTPGLHVPILATEVLYERKPDYVLLLAWNFAESIVARHRSYAGRASRFIVPLPDLALVGGAD
ncbi:MAG: class I SAM-dependent methyltransferase [Burkholderiales bacterium]|nr:class I SAM-dependent methyltransferase [Burkholderiales bacterium]